MRSTVELTIADRAWRNVEPDAAVCVRRAATLALGSAGAEARVAVRLTSDAEVRALNHRFRGVDAPTNVLAFPAPPNPRPGGEWLLGDVALAFGACSAEAKTQDKPLADHLSHLVIHGILHLLGHDHLRPEEAEAMEARERVLLAKLDIADPYQPRDGC